MQDDINKRATVDITHSGPYGLRGDSSTHSLMRPPSGMSYGGLQTPALKFYSLNGGE